MAKHSLAVALDVFSQFDAVDGGREEIGEPCLAFLKRKRSLTLPLNSSRSKTYRLTSRSRRQECSWSNSQRPGLGQSTTASPSILTDRVLRLAKASLMR